MKKEKEYRYKNAREVKEEGLGQVDVAVWRLGVSVWQAVWQEEVKAIGLGGKPGPNQKLVPEG